MRTYEARRRLFEIHNFKTKLELILTSEKNANYLIN